VCACLYTGTTCYSHGWISPRPVSLCVYSSGGLLPPDYKKDWWINNILLSSSPSLRPWSLCTPVFVCALVLFSRICEFVRGCVHFFLFVTMHFSIYICVCVCVCVSSISQWTRLSFICLIRGPSWHQALREGLLSDGARDKHGWRGKHSLYPRHQWEYAEAYVSARWHVCMRLFLCKSKNERKKRHLEKKNALTNDIFLLRDTTARLQPLSKKMLSLRILIKLPKHSH